MHCFKYALIFCLFSFFVYADQNDKRLDELFHILSHSQNDVEINNTTLDIWKIWHETNDPFIENDFNLGLELMQTGKLQLSIDMFSKIISTNPNFAEAWNKRATVYYLIGDFDSSILDIQNTLRLEPRHFGALDGLSLIFIHLTKYEKAINVYDQMLKFFPHYISTIKKRDRLLNLLSHST